MAAARRGDWRLAEGDRVEVGGVRLGPDEFELTLRPRAGYEVAFEGEVLVALDTELDAELEVEGAARELAHRIQNMRKAAGYQISDRVELAIAGDTTLLERLAAYHDWLADEVLATSLELGPNAELAGADLRDETALDGRELRISMRRAAG